MASFVVVVVGFEFFGGGGWRGVDMLFCFVLFFKFLMENL